MQIDLGLVAAAKKAVNAKPRKYVTPAILLAFVMQESSGVPYFIDHKPGSLFHMNLLSAWRGCGKRLSQSQIREIVTIPDKIGKFSPPKVMRGQLAKFRFESGYWNKNGRKHPGMSLEDRFIYSCSWGLVQFMAFNIAKPPTPENLEFIRRWIADPAMQLLYGAGMIDQLLVKAGGNVHHAYRGYNSGDIHSTRKDTNLRADRVVKMLYEIEEQIDHTAPKPQATITKEEKERMFKEIKELKDKAAMITEALELVAELKDSDVDGDGIKDYDEIIAIGGRIIEREKQNLEDMKELAKLTGGNFEKIKEVLGK